jgi:1-deoxy-D-xylulose-5-phosphate reductoisomerase
MQKQEISLLGSTGSIGKSTLEVAHNLQDSVKVVALAAHRQSDLLEAQADRFGVKKVALFDKEAAHALQKKRPDLTVLSGEEGLEEIALSAPTLVSAIVGAAGLKSTLAAVKKGHKIAPANKETLVVAGDLITEEAKKSGAALLPVDSEHSAIFQALQGNHPRSISRLILTGSGGPFRNFSTEALKTVTLDQALKHPTWQMGPKITIDSSTLMNKGLEIIEAHYLFKQKIDLVIHPQSIIHSMIEYIDGSIIAQMSAPTMLVPIQYALTYPERKQGLLPPFDFTKHNHLDFFTPDEEKFVALRLAREALLFGKGAPCYLNALNEVLVNRFLNKEISWYSIGEKLDASMKQFFTKAPAEFDLYSLEALELLDKEARARAAAI